MKRSDIMSDIEELVSESEYSEDVLDKLKDFIDYVEGKFNDIRTELTIERLADLGHIEAAFDIADEMSDNLY